tara:strand:+ start:18441 stop:19331 length:891 start_codon:yes stop_codon:yes gene_type:complete
MAFLDNSGDIIIDAVLTDTGRYRLAQGDGSFKISKFALGDDEIDYALYDADASDATADLQIMQTPILEAFTNNASSMKSKLVSLSRNNILYMPVLRENNYNPNVLNEEFQMYVVAADETTENNTNQTDANWLFGENFQNAGQIRIDQGIDSDAISPKFSIESDLEESQYIIEIDNRLGTIVSDTGPAAKIAFIDDDNIATYILAQNTDPSYVTKNASTSQAGEVIKGPRGTTIKFSIQSSIEVNTSTYLFDTLGSTGAAPMTGLTGGFKYIDTTVRIQGATTGAQIDLPVRFVKSS